MAVLKEEWVSTQDPFYNFPSVLALRDIRRILKETIEVPLQMRQMAHLLALDPLLLIRTLRLVNAPYLGQPERIGTIAGAIKVLGIQAGSALFKTPTADVAGSHRIRALWLHALITAQAAAALADQTGDTAPAKAYAAGLVHDFGLWLNCLKARQEGVEESVNGAELMASWNLPMELVEAVAWVEKSNNTPPPSPLAKILAGAESASHMIGFHHPDAMDLPIPKAKTFHLGTPKASQDLLSLVKKTLESVGMDIEHILNPDSGFLPTRKDRIPLGETRRTPSSLAKASSAILEFSRGDSLNDELEAMLVSIVGFLNFDRAWFVKWAGPGTVLNFRNCFDQTPTHHEVTTVKPTKKEMAFLGHLEENADPALLRRNNDDNNSILDHLASDCVVVAPVMAAVPTNAFLIADAAYQGLPPKEKTLKELRAVSGLSALVLENVLIQRLAWRQGHAANKDALTGIYNRRSSLSRLTRVLEESNHTDKISTILMLDIDNFKNINDTYGHPVGDEVLKMLARVLLDRFDDIGDVCRIGGEEFLVILGGKEPEEVLPFVEEVRQAVERTSLPLDKNRSIGVTVSIGVTATCSENDSVEALMLRCDRALYASKANGKNQFSVDLDLPEE